MSGNSFVDSENESLESKVNYITDSAERWQGIYEETLEGQPVEEDLEMVVDSYSLVLEEINRTHNIMNQEGYDELASELIETFEETLAIQSQYKDEVREVLGYTPADLFKEEHEIQ